MADGTVETLADKFYQYIKRSGDASFAELSRIAGEEGRGDLAWEIVPNVMLWSGMSQLMIDALRFLRERVEPVPAHCLVYFCDGAVPQLPIAKRLPKAGYKTQHWLPVVFRVRPEKRN